MAVYFSQSLGEDILCPFWTQGSWESSVLQNWSVTWIFEKYRFHLIQWFPNIFFLRQLEKRWGLWYPFNDFYPFLFNSCNVLSYRSKDENEKCGTLLNYFHEYLGSLYYLFVYFYLIFSCPARSIRWSLGNLWSHCACFSNHPLPEPWHCIQRQEWIFQTWWHSQKLHGSF